MAALDRASAGSCPSIVKACAVLREFQQSNGYEPGAKAVRGAQMQWLIDVAGLAGIQLLREFQQSNGYEPGAKAVRGAQMQWLIDVAGLAGICWIAYDVLAYDVLAEDEVWSVPTGIRSAGHRQPRAGVRSEAAAQV